MFSEALLWSVLSLTIVLSWSCARTISPPETSLKESLVPTVSGEPKTGWQAQWDELVNAAKQEGRLVIYGPPIAETRMAITEKFQKLA